MSSSIFTKRLLTHTVLGLTALSGLHVLRSSLDAEAPAGPITYEVSITNLTRGQPMSPTVVATHDEDAALFTLGAPASAELAMVAEDAVTGPLMDLLRGNDHVGDVQLITGAGGPILPGETATIMIQGQPGRFGRLSLAGMLVVTNDAFCGLGGVELPLHGRAAYTAVAYDAGSEGNNELCAFIPGPPCNNPNVRNTATAEGFVHVHAGIQGGGDLVPAQHDWRNPVAHVVVRRVRG